MARESIPAAVRRQVLTEAGYRCAVPTCRNILALDLHHIEEVAEGGGNDPGNLLALCPTCHALYTRGLVHRESIDAWKTMLVSLSHAFDAESISNLLFLARKPPALPLELSGDGVLKFSHLIASGLATFGSLNISAMSGDIRVSRRYSVFLTPKGQRIIDAWKHGSRNEIRAALSGIDDSDEDGATVP